MTATATTALTMAPRVADIGDTAGLVVARAAEAPKSSRHRYRRKRGRGC